MTPWESGGVKPAFVNVYERYSPTDGRRDETEGFHCPPAEDSGPTYTKAGIRIPNYPDIRIPIFPLFGIRIVKKYSDIRHMVKLAFSQF